MVAYRRFIRTLGLAFGFLLVLFISLNTVQAADISVQSLPFNGWLALGTNGFALGTVTTELVVSPTPADSFTIEGSFQWTEKVNDIVPGGLEGYLIIKSGGYGLSLFKYCTDLVPVDCPDYVFRYWMEGTARGMLISSSYFVPGQWHSAALVYDGDVRMIRMYVDGDYIGVTPYSSLPIPGGNIGVGYFPGATSGNGMISKIDEVRISAVARYTDAYTPSSTPFNCDEHTRALWHFDEVEGSTTFHDSCGTEDNLLTSISGAHTEAFQYLFLPLLIR